MKPNYYSILTADVRYADITPNAKLLFSEITALCDKEGYCWAGNPYFAELYGVDRDTVRRWLGELQEIGVIEITGSTSKRRIHLTAKMSEGLTAKRSSSYRKKVADNNTRILSTTSEEVVEPTPALEATRFFNDPEKREGIIRALVSRGWSEQLARDEIAKFVSYWVELTPGGKKQKWQTERTFEFRRRLATWLNNAAKWGQQRRQNRGKEIVGLTL